MQWRLKIIDCLVWMGINSMISDQYDTLHNRRLNGMPCFMCIVVSIAALGQQLITSALAGLMNLFPPHKTIETSIAPMTIRYSAYTS